MGFGGAALAQPNASGRSRMNIKARAIALSHRLISCGRSAIVLSGATNPWKGYGNRSPTNARVRKPSLSPSRDSSALTTAALNAPVLSDRIVFVVLREGIATRVMSRPETPSRSTSMVINVAWVSPTVPTAIRFPLRSEIFWMSAAANKYQVTFSV